MSEDFEYSAEINTPWLRGPVGNALSAYRHELIRMIQFEQERPIWVSEDVWLKLVKLEGSEKFKMKSEQMRFANSCRRSKGRTGPIGEIGIREKLRIQLGRSPEPQKLQDEMRRDKGYYGRPHRTQKCRISVGGPRAEETNRMANLNDRGERSSPPSLAAQSGHCGSNTCL